MAIKPSPHYTITSFHTFLLISVIYWQPALWSLSLKDGSTWNAWVGLRLRSGSHIHEFKPHISSLLSARRWLQILNHLSAHFLPILSLALKKQMAAPEYSFSPQTPTEDYHCPPSLAKWPRQLSSTNILMELWLPFPIFFLVKNKQKQIQLLLLC